MRHVYIISSNATTLRTARVLASTQPELTVQVFASAEIFWAKAAHLSASIIVFDLGSACACFAEELARLTRAAAGFGVIALTDCDDMQQVVNAMKAGALDVIAQPIDADALLTAIDSGLAHLSKRFENTASRVEARRIIATLSRREGEIFTHLLDGQANKIVAFELALSVRTIEIYRSHVMSKLGVRSMAEACGIAFHAGVFPKNPPARLSALAMSN